MKDEIADYVFSQLRRVEAGFIYDWIERNKISVNNLEMETNLKKSNSTSGERSREVFSVENVGDVLGSFEKRAHLTELFQKNRFSDLVDLLSRLLAQAGKRSFLVFKHNKYSTVPTDDIAYFYVKHESTIIMSLAKQEFSVNYALDHIQNLLSDRQFFRLNRQYLINFCAVKEVERYFDRKLVVHLVVPAPDKLLVSKEKVSSFLKWLEDR